MSSTREPIRFRPLERRLVTAYVRVPGKTTHYEDRQKREREIRTIQRAAELAEKEA